jgi:hypothetical protein
MEQKFVIDLGGSQDLEYKLPNEIDRKTGKPKPHRSIATGTDRSGNAKLLSVIGMMPKFIHEPNKEEENPRSLVIFEWNMSPERNDVRFRSVTIEVTFSAEGARGEAEAEAVQLREQGYNDNYWDPEVVRMVPAGESLYNTTQHKITGKNSFELGFSVSFNQYISIGPKWTMERVVDKNRIDSVKVTGKQTTVGPSRYRPNGVRWTLLENKSLQSSVPAYMRTAVLLKRNPRDNGLFIATIKVTTHVSWWEDLLERKHKLDGSVKEDDPIIFDPTIEDPTADLSGMDLEKEFKIITLEQPKEKPDGAKDANAEASSGQNSK